jgi:hypothetical protein
MQDFWIFRVRHGEVITGYINPYAEPWGEDEPPKPKFRDGFYWFDPDGDPVKRGDGYGGPFPSAKAAKARALSRLRDLGGKAAVAAAEREAPCAALRPSPPVLREGWRSSPSASSPQGGANAAKTDIRQREG